MGRGPSQGGAECPHRWPAEPLIRARRHTLAVRWTTRTERVGWPPAQPENEPRMDDGSHLLTSERGRRVIDPATGRRMIRTMALTDDAWPHWEWSKDLEGAAGVGPWSPDVSFGTHDEPAGEHAGTPDGRSAGWTCCTSTCPGRATSRYRACLPGGTWRDRDGRPAASRPLPPTRRHRQGRFLLRGLVPAPGPGAGAGW